MSSLDSLYQELILDHAKHPHGKGELSNTVDPTASHHELNPSCGDEITVDIALNPAAGTVSELKWRGQGCSISMASASVLAQLINQRQPSVEETQQLIAEFRSMLQARGVAAPNEELLEDAVAFAGVGKFVMRIKCAMLSWVALEADLKQLAASL